MTLDTRGKISVVQIICYIPVIIIAIILVSRHGKQKKTGWIFLLTFSAVRIIGGGLIVYIENTTNPSKSIVTTAYTLVGVGVSPLLSSTTSFVVGVGHGLDIGPMSDSQLSKIFHLGLVGGIALLAIGGQKSASTDSSTANTGAILRKAGALIIGGVYLALVGVHFLFWSNHSQLPSYRRKLLLGISLGLPFLAVRILYSILGAFAPASIPGAATEDSSNNAFSKFNSLTGSILLYIVMSVIMEFIVVVIYCLTGLTQPKIEIDDDDEGGSSRRSGPRAYMLHQTNDSADESMTYPPHAVKPNRVVYGA